ncbi:hypothetical protein BJY52DRAFT_1125973, partial [Lactarius psammicola]
QLSILEQFRALDYGMEYCILALRIPKYGMEVMEIARIGSTRSACCSVTCARYSKARVREPDLSVVYTKTSIIYE